MIFAKVECEDRNTERLINAFLDKGVRIKSLKRKQGKVSFCVRERDLKRAEEVLAKDKREFTVLSRGGSNFLGKFALKYLALAICAVAAITGICLGSGLCLGVEIDSATKAQTAEINGILQEYGYKKYMKKSDLDTKALSYAISSRIEDIGFAGCYFDGGILKIDVRSVHADESEESYSQIVAASDGIVTRVLVFSGTALVDEGDVVKAGDVLIAGYIDTAPGSEDNVRISVEASGEVYAECAYTERVTLSQNAVERVRTGKSCKNTVIYLFGKAVGKEYVPEYENFESVTESKIFGSVIPLKAVTTTYYEIEERQTELSQAQIDEQISVFEMQLWQNLPPQAKLLKNYTLRKKVDNLYIIDIYYIVEQGICQGV